MPILKIVNKTHRNEKMNMTVFRWLIAVLAILLIQGSYIPVDEYERAQIRERIKPLGRVRTEPIDESQQTKSSPKLEKADEPSGQKIYEKYCAVCHNSGLAGAPKFRDKKDWQLRLKEKDLEALTHSAVVGLNAMPAKGTCMECSDADIKRAIEYMVSK